jgi:hypothetical protein
MKFTKIDLVRLVFSLIYILIIQFYVKYPIKKFNSISKYFDI